MKEVAALVGGGLAGYGASTALGLSIQMKQIKEAIGLGTLGATAVVFLNGSDSPIITFVGGSLLGFAAFNAFVFPSFGLTNILIGSSAAGATVASYYV